jgi:hypothetical protein
VEQLGTGSFRSPSALQSYDSHSHRHLNPAQEKAGLPRSDDTHKITGSQAHGRNKLQSKAARPINTRENQMVRGKHKNLSIRNQGSLASSEPSSPTTASPGYPKILEKYDSDLKITSWSNPLSPAWDTFRPGASPLNYLMYLHQDSLFVIFGCTPNRELSGGFPTRFFHLEAPERSAWHPGTPKDPLEICLFVWLLHVVCCLSVVPLNLCLGFSVLRLWICVLVLQFWDCGFESHLVSWFYSSEIVGLSPTRVPSSGIL